MIKLYDFLRKFEYHKNEKYIFVGFNYVNELFEFIGTQWIEDGLQCWVSSGCLVFNAEELIDCINDEWTEEIIGHLDEINE